MKIAFVPSTFLPWIGGAEIQTHNMANKMVEIGNTVDVLLLKKVKLNNNSYNIVKLIIFDVVLPTWSLTVMANE